MKTLAVASIMMCLATAALAAEQSCYERNYDAAHLKKHKLQEVIKIRLDVSQAGSQVTGQIKAGFRESENDLSSDVTCESLEEAKEVMCKVSDEGGGFQYMLTPKGIKLTNTSQIRFGGADDGVTITGEAEHRVFLLFKTDCAN